MLAVPPVEKRQRGVGAMEAVLGFLPWGIGCANVAGYFTDGWTQTGDIVEGFRAGYWGRSVGSQKEVL